MIIDFLTNKACKFILFLFYYFFVATLVGLLFKFVAYPLLYKLVFVMFNASVIKNINEQELLISILAMALYHYFFEKFLIFIDSKLNYHSWMRKKLKESLDIKPISIVEYLDKIFIFAFLIIFAAKVLFGNNDMYFQAITIYFVLFTIFNSKTEKNY